MLLFELAAVIIAATVLCLYTGWGVARLALPASLAPFRAPLVPLIGYAVFGWSSYMLTSLALNLRDALIVIGLGATLLNGLAWRVSGPPRLLAWLRIRPEGAALPLLALLTGLVPLIWYGYPTIIGQNWDTEVYLPMAQHLIDYPLPRISEAPPNLLRDLVADPPAIGLTLLFSTFHGAAMILSGTSALVAFTPVIALMRALAALAIYVWLGASMGCGRIGALLGTTLTILTALMLWIGYFNFGMQMSAWPLLPLSITVGLAAVEDVAQRRRAAWPVALLAAIVLAALAAVYYPALVIVGPLIIATGLARLIETRWALQPSLGALVGAAAVIATLTLALATLAIVDYFEGFSFRYSLIEPKVGPDRFISLAEILGLTAFRLPPTGAQPPAWLTSFGLLIAAFLTVAAFAIPPHAGAAPVAPRLRWLLVLLALAASLFWLRFGRPYEYGFMKGAAYTSFALWGMAAYGAEQLATHMRRAGAALAGAAAAVLIAATAWAQTLTIADHVPAPALFTRDITAFETVAAGIPRGATVLLSSDETLTGPPSGLVATFLYGKTIIGRVASGYATQAFWPAEQTPAYVVLAAREPAWPLELGGEEIWRSRMIALYRLPANSTLIAGRSEIHASAPVNAKSPADLAIWRQAGANRWCDPANPLTLTFSQPQRVRLTVATLAAQTVTLRQDDVTTNVALSEGVHVIEAVAASLQLAPAAPLALVEGLARPWPAPLPASVRRDASQIAWQATSVQQGNQVVTTVRLANPGQHALRYELIIVSDTFQHPHQLARLFGAAPIAGEWQVAVDPIRGAAEARVNGAPTPLFAAEIAPADGRYFGVMLLYSGDTPVAYAPLFTLTIAQQAMTAFMPVARSVETATAGWAAPLPAHQRALLGGGPLIGGEQALALEQAIITRPTPPPGVTAATPLRPGEQLVVQLYWRAETNARSLHTPMISLQLLDSADRKVAQWDGLLGGWYPPPAWEAGVAVRQDVPLTIDPAASAGSYRLLLVLYDPVTGSTLPLDGQAAVGLGEVAVAPITDAPAGR